MKNFVQKGEMVDVVGPTGGLLSGDPCVFGVLPGIAVGDIAAGAKGVIATRGIFNLSVKAVDASANSAVAFGNRIYMDSGELNKDATNGVSFGVALGAVAAGETGTIPVKIG